MKPKTGLRFETADDYISKPFEPRDNPKFSNPIALIRMERPNPINLAH